MQTKQNWLWLGLITSVLLTSCGDKKKEEEEKKEEEGSVSTMGAMGALKEMADQAQEIGKKGPVETVDFRKLKELLPADADGLPRKEATGEKNGVAGFSMSTAEGKYSNDDGSQTIEIDLIDAGGSAATIGLAAWSMMDVDKETENGYEKTTKMGDNKAYEKYDNANKEGEIAVLVNKRYIVTAKGRGVSMDKIKSVVEDIDLTKLEETK